LERRAASGAPTPLVQGDPSIPAREVPYEPADGGALAPRPRQAIQCN
jgi:hypothetical protein